jgi:hypothetical protein
MTFAIAERVGKPTQTRKELFLLEGGGDVRMGLITLVNRYYSKG